MKIFVSAAEISSDLQAEKMVRALIAQFPLEAVEIYGIGGPRLRSIPGFQCIENAENLRAMGFAEVLVKLRVIKKILEKTVETIRRQPPDVLITFDYPDFHFQLLKRVYRLPECRKTLKICGIPPKVWVWRSKRVEKIREYYDGVWVIFPFEKQFYENLGIPVIYQGNPLMGELLATPQREKNILWNERELRIAVMPGSRDAELKHHLPIVQSTLLLLSKKLKTKVIAEVPVPKGLALESFNQTLKDTESLQYVFSEGDSAAVLGRNSLGLIKSGTSTLEAAVLACVPVIFYRSSWITEWIFRLLVRYAGPVGLPNILLGVRKRVDAVYSEFLGGAANADALSEEMLKLIYQPELLQHKKDAGARLRGDLVPSSAIPEAVATSIKSWLVRRPERRLSRQKHAGIFAISFIWSTLNYFRRRLQHLGILKSASFSIPSILVGNLQAGGAGKTPLVIEIAKEGMRRGYRVGVVSRGYGKKNRKAFLLDSNQATRPSYQLAELAGDEPSEIFRAVPGVVVAVGSNRPQSVEALKTKGVNLILFDDGFQNLGFRADISVLALTDCLPSEVVFRDFETESRFADFCLQMKGSKKGNAISVEWNVDSLPTQPIWLVCGLADPSEVIHFYENQGVEIRKVLLKKDHGSFESREIELMMHDAELDGCILAMTEKDWVKLEGAVGATPFVLKRKMKNLECLESIFVRLQSSLQSVKL